MTLNLERLGSLTSELSSHLIRSIVWPGELFRRVPRRPRTAAAPEVGDPRTTLPTGAILWVGGEEIPDDAVVVALHRAGGRHGPVAAVGVGGWGAARAPEALRRFARYGARPMEAFSVSTREEADSPEWESWLSAARVVVLCAGDPAEARELLQASRCQAALQGVLAAGGVVVGLGEGGTLLGHRYLTAPPEGAPRLEEGLGLMPPVLLPAALSLQKYSPGGLLCALGLHLGAAHLGLAVDPGAGILVTGDEVRVLGAGTVCFVDGSEALPAPAEVFRTPMEVPVTAETPPALGLKVHVLPAGYGLNLRSRRTLGPPQAPLQVAGY